uniref:BHLH domain-containing protein n=1 Tax=Macrostomum lignano TaxID=282301 RepID=A0A1I8F6S3_9PLAT
GTGKQESEIKRLPLFGADAQAGLAFAGRSDPLSIPLPVPRVRPHRGLRLAERRRRLQTADMSRKQHRARLQIYIALAARIRRYSPKLALLPERQPNSGCASPSRARVLASDYEPESGGHLAVSWRQTRRVRLFSLSSADVHPPAQLLRLPRQQHGQMVLSGSHRRAANAANELCRARRRSLRSREPPAQQPPLATGHVVSLDEPNTVRLATGAQHCLRDGLAMPPGSGGQIRVIQLAPALLHHCRRGSGANPMQVVHRATPPGPG